jgi:uncharacterized protein with FMN-binding domain
VTVRRALAAILVTAAAVVALVRFQTHPPRTVNPNSALRSAARAPAHARPPAGVRSAAGPPLTTPFSIVQVQATLTHGRLTGVKTIALTGDGPHTQAINARAEPILRAEALRAHSAHVDHVSGATYTSRVWTKSLRQAIERGRRG